MALLAFLVLGACRIAPTAPSPEPSSTASHIDAPASPAATVSLAAQVPNAHLHELIVIHTNDEHGHLLPTERGDFLIGGAGNSAASWQSRPDDPQAGGSPVLLLSGGDNWVGPAISTWSKGESTIELMNAMGYRASVIGNHEFDFGLELLQERISQADFPFLAANIYREGSQDLPEWVDPYLVIEVNEIKVGIIGLALRQTPGLTSPANVSGLTFGDYESALRRWAPVVRAAGAQIIIVEAHVCPDDLLRLAAQVQDLGIALFEGGHCHESRTSNAKGALINAASANWRDYTLTRLVYDSDSAKVVSKRAQLVDVLYPKSGRLPAIPPAVERLIAKWDERTQLALGEVIGYTATGLGQHSESLYNLLVDSWLWAYAPADVAISNTGGFRQGIPPGEITYGDIVGVFPFENVLLDLTVTGKQISDVLQAEGDQLVVGGLRMDARRRFVFSDGEPLQPDRSYHLLTTDYLYSNDKYRFHSFDSEPYEVSIQWRQPVIDWVRAQHSDRETPLETSLDSRPRL